MTAQHHQIPKTRHWRPALYSVPRHWSGCADGSPPAGHIDCDGHGQSDDRFLCADCEQDFRRHLADVPLLLVELDTALTKQVRFAERGHTRDVEVRDESPVSFNPAARKALQRIVDALHFPDVGSRRAADRDPVRHGLSAARWMAEHVQDWLRSPDVPEIASEVARAVVAGRRVIERPRDITYYGVCGGCSSDIRQERVDPEDRQARVECVHCGWSAPFSDHLLANLEAGDDRWLTVDELVGVIEKAPGETVTRQQIMRWRDHHGLPRDVRVVPTLDGTTEIEVFRLGDVRRFAQDDAAEDRGLTSADLAVRWGKRVEQIKLLVNRNQLTPIRAGAKPLRFTHAEVQRFEAATRK